MFFARKVGFAALCFQAVWKSLVAEDVCDGGCMAMPDGSAMLQLPDSTSRKHRQLLQVSEPSGDIVYVVRSSAKNYDTRLRSIMDTWGRSVNGSDSDDALLIVGDTFRENDPHVVSASTCDTDHWRGLTCKSGYSLQRAYSTYPNHKWFFVLDDDVYVNVANVKKALANYDTTKTIALGIPGCGPGLCEDSKGGFCGGGGYVLSKASMDAIMNHTDLNAFSAELMDHLASDSKGNTWDDITVSCALKRHGVELLQFDGLNAWSLKGEPRQGHSLNTGYMDAIHSESPLPMTFHYVHEDQMRELHIEFSKLSTETGKAVALMSYGHARKSLDMYHTEMRDYVNDVNRRMGLLEPLSK